MTSRTRFVAGAILVGACACIGLSAQGVSGGAQMPDPKQMSGLPLPVGDLAVGTVTVRVVKGTMANVVPNQPVELSLGFRGSALSRNTNDSGRAEFTGLQPGVRVKAVTTVNGERLESQEFEVPSTGGIRVVLVATDPEALKKTGNDSGQAQSPAQAGTLVLGDQSRFVFEMGDETVNVFNILYMVNGASTPVQTPAPVVFDLPAASRGAGLLDGSSPQAVLTGPRVTVNGPFAPGATIVQFAYSVPFGSGEFTLQQPLPLALNQVTVLVEKLGDLRFESPQLAEHREMDTAGQTYIAGQGPALQAGSTLTFTFAGLPHAATWPRNTALALALAILAGGAWGTLRSGRATATADRRRQKLQEKRNRLFDELTSLEQQSREQSLSPERCASRRRELVEALERVYAAMDEDAAA